MRRTGSPFPKVDSSFLSSLQDFNPCCLCLQGGLRGDDPETTLTAFVLIALAEAKRAGIGCTGPDVEVRSISLTVPIIALMIPSLSAVVLLNILLPHVAATGSCP